MSDNNKRPTGKMARVLSDCILQAGQLGAFDAVVRLYRGLVVTEPSTAWDPKMGMVRDVVKQTTSEVVRNRVLTMSEAMEYENKIGEFISRYHKAETNEERVELQVGIQTHLSETLEKVVSKVFDEEDVRQGSRSDVTTGEQWNKIADEVASKAVAFHQRLPEATMEQALEYLRGEYGDVADISAFQDKDGSDALKVVPKGISPDDLRVKRVEVLSGEDTKTNKDTGIRLNLTEEERQKLWKDLGLDVD